MTMSLRVCVPVFVDIALAPIPTLFTEITENRDFLVRTLRYTNIPSPSL